MGKDRRKRPVKADRRWIAALAVFWIVFLGHYHSRHYFCGDTVGSIYLSMSMYREGNTDLDEYVPVLEAMGQGRVLERQGGHTYWIFPLGVSLLGVPFVAAADLYYRLVYYIDLDTLIRFNPPIPLEAAVAAFSVALTAVLLYLMARRRLPGALSLLFAFIFAYCTSAWSVASRVLWQHGPSMMLLTGSLYLLELARQKPSLARYAGIPLLFSYVVRPTNSLSLAVLTAYVLVYHRKEFLRYAAYTCLAAVPFVVYNLSVYGFVLSPYYLPGRVGANPHFLEALAGNLVSPSRGLLVFMPVFVLSLSWTVLRIARKQGERIELFLLAIVVLHWLVISSFPHWWGGWTFGPRFFSDMIPYLLYLLLPFLADLAEAKSRRRAWMGAGIAVFVLFGFLVHYAGANLPEASAWNAIPKNVDLFPERLWDWSDPQFLRGILR